MRLWVWLCLSACGFHPGVASDGGAPGEGTPELHTWGSAVNLADLNTLDSDGDPWVSSDGCHIYFAAANAGNYDIYEADVL